MPPLIRMALHQIRHMSGSASLLLLLRAVPASSASLPWPIIPLYSSPPKARMDDTHFFCSSGVMLASSASSSSAAPPAGRSCSCR